MPEATSNRRMRATLVRFGPELFEELKAEAERSGVSIAQFVREAVVARIAYSAGRRGEDGYALPHAKHVLSESERLRDEAAALRAQGRQAAGHARRTRAERKAS
jgi:hypothetical protein